MKAKTEPEISPEMWGSDSFDGVLKAKTNAQRQKASDDRHREAGRVQRKVWATPGEHDWLKEQLDNKRKTS